MQLTALYLLYKNILVKENFSEKSSDGQQMWKKNAKNVVSKRWSSSPSFVSEIKYVLCVI